MFSNHVIVLFLVIYILFIDTFAPDLKQEWKGWIAKKSRALPTETTNIGKPLFWSRAL